MQEVQFVSDLAINLVEGLVDFSATKINRYYKDYDVEFPQAIELSERFEDLFTKLSSVPTFVFSDTVFQQQQLAFSLLARLIQRGQGLSVDFDRAGLSVRRRGGVGI